MMARNIYSCSLDCADVCVKNYTYATRLKNVKFSAKTKGTLEWTMSFDFLCVGLYEINIFLYDSEEIKQISRKTSLFNSEGEEVYSLRENFQNLTGRKWWPAVVFKQDLLFELKLVNRNNYFAMTIRCDILTSEEMDDEFYDVYATEYRLLEDLSKLCTTKEDSDVTLLFDGIKVPAHRSILMLRSPVFKAMFQHNTAEKMTNVVEITDVKVDTAKEMINFMYTGQPPKFDDPVLAEELLVAAEKYAMEDLKELCQDHLIKITSTESVLNYLTLAHINHANRLENFCLHFVRFNREQFLINDDMCSFWKEFPDLFEKAFQSLTTSET